MTLKRVVRWAVGNLIIGLLGSFWGGMVLLSAWIDRKTGLPPEQGLFMLFVGALILGHLVGTRVFENRGFYAPGYTWMTGGFFAALGYELERTGLTHKIPLIGVAFLAAVAIGYLKPKKPLPTEPTTGGGA